MKKYDVIVCGGGFAGSMAAIAAAREGLTVLLLEKSGALGGAAHLNQVNPFMTTYEHKPVNGVIPGLFAAFSRKLMDCGGSLSIDGPLTLYFNEEYVKIVLDEMTDLPGLTVLFHSTVIGAVTDGRKLTAVEYLNVAGRETAFADYFIDASGDALLCRLAGAGTRLGRQNDHKCQPMTLCFRMGNVDTDRFWQEDYEKMNRLWKERQAKGELMNPRENILAFPHIIPGILHLNTTRLLLSPADPEEKSRAEKLGRKQMLEMYDFLRKNAPSCKEATLLTSASEIGVRESYMIDGEYTITEEDLLSCTKFPDAIATGSYGVDIHSPDGSGTRMRAIPHGEFYTIPYRATVSRDFDNLLAAGRCLSSTHEAQSAYRVMPIVAAIGEGVGIAVSLLFKNHLAARDLPVRLLRSAIDRYDLIEGYPESGEKNVSKRLS